MGGFNPITPALQAAKVFTNYRDVQSGYDHAKNTYQEKERDLAEKSALDAQKLQIEQDEETRDRKNALRRAVAEQQAKFGAQGISTSDGSGEAVMQGLYQESSDQKSYRDRLNRWKSDALSQENTSQRRRNLLDLQESSVGRRDSIFKKLGSLTSE